MLILQQIDWSAVLQIIAIDILLGGDNAVVIALACRDLPAAQRRRGIVWGTVAAIALRVVLIAFALQLLNLPFLKIVGGLLLFWIGVKLLVPHVDKHGQIQGGQSLAAAIRTIVVADLVMSVDNILAIAGAAEGTAQASHRIGLVVFGLLASVPIVVWGSTLVLRLIDRFPLVVTLGAALLGWIGAGMIMTDIFVVNQFGPPGDMVKFSLEALGALTVVLIGEWIKRRTHPVPGPKES